MTIYQKLQERFGDKVRRQVPLAPFTTMKVGGAAQLYFEAGTTEELKQAIKAAIELNLPYFVFGGGSNIIVGDDGIEGLVIRNRSHKISVRALHGKVSGGKNVFQHAIVEVSSGTIINRLVRFTLDEGLAGLEYHLGLPGTVGGALYMNSKWTNPVTYIGDVLHEAVIITNTGEIQTVSQEYFNFGYDQSILQQTHDTVLSARFLLKHEDKESLWERARAALAYRKKTQPIGVASAGCTFRNIAQSDAVRIPTPQHITSAGYLVDRVGLKGYRVGNAQFSDHHANFILNHGTATARDVKQLIDEAEKRIKEQYHVQVQPEVVLVGAF